eukprot:1667934-Amphidinium_carterae.2
MSWESCVRRCGGKRSSIQLHGLGRAASRRESGTGIHLAQERTSLNGCDLGKNLAQLLRQCRKYNLCV